ncbi:hypothetical protein PUN28_009732 [Cardiocondyla obscurior]|uniref:THAP-type domain-containing protein n=1 Tax=Cardiocondyla obscurior TaxID=286306 RepID=A0AAW2FR40_9HYME
MSERGGYCCCIHNCNSSSNPKRGIKTTLFRFPKDTKRSRLWVLACGRDNLLNKTAMELYNNYRVCKLHFENKMFFNFEKTRLQPNAVPNFQIRNKSM